MLTDIRISIFKEQARASRRGGETEHVAGHMRITGDDVLRPNEAKVERDTIHKQENI